VTTFTCPFCGTTTGHPEDVAERYCSVCNVFADDVGRAADAVERGELSQADLERLTAGTGFTVPRIQRALGDERG
jgi:hypothetical protein